MHILEMKKHLKSIENRKSVKNIHKIKSWISEKINEINKHLIRIKKGRYNLLVPLMKEKTSLNIL